MRWFRRAKPAPNTPTPPALPTPTPCQSAVQQIVMEELRGAFPQYSATQVWTSGVYDTAHWLPLFEVEQAAIDRLLQWAKTLQDACFQDAYEDWLRFYQRQLDEARTELRTCVLRDRSAAYHAKWEYEDEQARRFRQEHEIPQPPRQEPRL